MWHFFARDSSKSFPYEIKDKYSNSSSELSCFSLFKGISKSTKENVTIFLFDKKSGSSEQYEHAKACVKRLKTLRHPSILTYLDSQENDSCLYIATEYVETLLDYLEEFEDAESKALCIPWGILSIIKAVSFLNNDAKLRHNNIFFGAIFVNNSGEWKLGEVGYVSDLSSVFPPKVINLLQKYNPPEINNNLAFDDSSFWAIDSWGLGVFMWEVYNGPIKNSNSLKNLAKIPESLLPMYCNLVVASPNKRLNAVKILDRSKRGKGYLNNHVVEAMLFLEEIHIKTKEESKHFFSNISPFLKAIPTNCLSNKVLPQMLRAYEYGCDGACLVQPMLEISKSLREHQHQQTFVPFIIKLFSSPDRATRSLLLQNIEQIIDKLPEATINESIFPLLTNGFIDANPRIREETVKAIVYLAPKLSTKNLNEEVLRHFARLQAKDEQGGIRTNTTVCLGKIAYCLCPQNRKVILLSAFLRALSDPFPPVRNAGVLAFAVSQQYFELEDIGKKILPSLCQLTLDVDQSVRESTFRTIKGFIGKLEKVSENPALRQEMDSEIMSTTKPVASWAEWAVTAVASKFSSRLTLDSDEKKVQHIDKIEEATPKNVILEPDKQEDDKNDFQEAGDKFESKQINLETDDFDWDGESWGALEDPLPEPEQPPPPPPKNIKTRQKPPQEKKKRVGGPMKLGTRISDVKFD